MIWILMLAGAGATWAIVDALAVGFLLVCIAIPVIAVIFFANYINDFSGINDVLVNSYQWIVGVENPNDMMAGDCTGAAGSGDFLGIVLTFAFIAVLFLVAVATALTGMASSSGFRSES